MHAPCPVPQCFSDIFLLSVCLDILSGAIRKPSPTISRSLSKMSIHNHLNNGFRRQPPQGLSSQALYTILSLHETVAIRLEDEANRLARRQEKVRLKRETMAAQVQANGFVPATSNDWVALMEEEEEESRRQICEVKRSQEQLYLSLMGMCQILSSRE